MPKVSVILPVFNDERSVAEAMRSILEQSFVDFEFIVINDGSTDNTAQVLNTFIDPRLLVIHQDNQGISRTLNRAISISSGKYIARMDSDDTSHCERLERQVNFLDRNPDYGMVGSACKVIAENGSLVRDFRVPLTDTAIRKAMVWYNPIVHSSVMIRRDVLSRTNCYDEQLSSIGHDYELWWHMLAISKIANLADRLVTRVHRYDSTFRLEKSRHYRAMVKIQLRALRLRYAPVTIVLACGANAMAWALYSMTELLMHVAATARRRSGE